MDIEQCTKPTITAINGIALSGGCEIVMDCDIHFASSRAKIGQTELNVSILPGVGSTQRLTQLVGLGRAMQMILTGEPMDALTAFPYDLITQVTEPEALMDAALTLAQRLIVKSPITLRLAKLAVRKGAKTNFSTAFQLKLLCQSVLFSTRDHLEGFNAFLEKRPPEYRGK